MQGWALMWPWRLAISDRLLGVALGALARPLKVSLRPAAVLNAKRYQFKPGKSSSTPPNTLNDANGADLIMIPASPFGRRPVLVNLPLLFALFSGQVLFSG